MHRVLSSPASPARPLADLVQSCGCRRLRFLSHFHAGKGWLPAGCGNRVPGLGVVPSELAPSWRKAGFGRWWAPHVEKVSSGAQVGPGRGPPAWHAVPCTLPGANAMLCVCPAPASWPSASTPSASRVRGPLKNTGQRPGGGGGSGLWAAVVADQSLAGHRRADLERPSEGLAGGGGPDSQAEEQGTRVCTCVSVCKGGT